MFKLIHKNIFYRLLLSWNCGKLSYVHKRSRLYFLVISFATYSSISLAQPIKSVIPILMDNAWVYIAAEFWYEKREPTITFQVGQTTNLTGDAERTLARYYERAKANQINSVIDLYSQEDGSRLRFRQVAQSNPDILSTYADLGTVTLGNKALWGLYQLLNVKLTGGSGTTEWREDLLCQGNDCGMSDIMDNSNSSERIVEATLAITMAFFESGVNLSEYQNTIKNVIDKNIKIDILPEIQPPGSQLYPLTFYTDLIKLEGTATFRLDADNNFAGIPKIQALVDMLKSVRNAQESELELIIPNFWTSYPGGGLVRMTDKKIQNEIPTKNLTLGNYTWAAFHGRIKKWNAIKILGIARVQEADFLFVEPILSDGRFDTIQLFTVLFNSDTQTYKFVTDSDQIVPWYIISEPLFMQFIHDKYGSS
jgi:hypothetical protein